MCRMTELAKDDAPRRFQADTMRAIFKNPFATTDEKTDTPPSLTGADAGLALMREMHGKAAFPAFLRASDPISGRKFFIHLGKPRLIIEDIGDHRLVTVNLDPIPKDVSKESLAANTMEVTQKLLRWLDKTGGVP
jgi:hypothetical protein